MNNNYYNYVYLDPEKPIPYKIKGLDIILTHEPFYVGKRTGKRINYHKYGCSSKFMNNKVTSLKNKGLEPVIVKLIDNISNIEACENEKYLIKIIGRRDLKLGSLCNLTDGGEGTPGNKRSMKTRKKMSEAQRGKTLSQEHKNKLSAIGKLRTDYNKGLKIAQDYWLTHKRTTNSKKVNMLDLNNNIIKTFDSCTEAAKYINLSISHISKLCISLERCKSKPLKFRYNDK